MTCPWGVWPIAPTWPGSKGCRDSKNYWTTILRSRWPVTVGTPRPAPSIHIMRRRKTLVRFMGNIVSYCLLLVSAAKSGYGSKTVRLGRDSVKVRLHDQRLCLLKERVLWHARWHTHTHTPVDYLWPTYTLLLHNVFNQHKKQKQYMVVSEKHKSANPRRRHVLAREGFHVKAKLRKTDLQNLLWKAVDHVSMLPSGAHLSLCICHVF